VCSIQETVSVQRRKNKIFEYVVLVL